MLERYNDLGAFDDLTGEPRVKLANFYKLAAVNEIADFISKFKPDPKFLYIHVIAMGAGEFYGCNKNGDYFPERSLIAYHKTFETNAKVFKEHNNKPTSPSYGFVPISWYNPEMHRVELILAIDKEKAPDIVEQVEKGSNPVEVSMGARVPNDVCSICGNKSSKKSEYCDHIRYHNKEVFPDGRQAYMLNLTPKFFDISIVRRRADRIAYMLSKVASEDGLDLSHIHDVVESKLAAIDKRIPAMAVIGKLNRGYHNLLPAIEAAEPDLPPAMLDRMALTHDIPTILSSFLHSAIPMKPREYARVIVINLGMPVQSIPDVLAGMSQAPRYHEMQLPPFSPDILGMLGQYLNQRSAFGPCVRRRVESLGPILKLASFPDVDPYSIGAAPMPLYYSSGTKIPVTYQYNAIPAQVMAEQYYQRAQTAKNIEPFSIGVLLGKLFKSSHEPQTLTQLAKSLNNNLTKVACDLGEAGIEMLQELQKTAGVGGKILGYGVAPFVGAHMVAAHARRKYYQGQELSSVEQFAADNPDYLGVAAPVAMIGAKKMLFKRAGEDDLETKIANFADVLSDSAVQGLIFRAKGVSGGGGITDMVLDNVLWHHIGDKLKGSQPSPPIQSSPLNQATQTPTQPFKPQY